MFLKTHQLQAAYARRRDIENQRLERTAALSRYYDHWGQVTNRFGNWTKPEYYKQVEEQLKQTKEKKEQQQQLEARRRKLHELLNKEQKFLDHEMKKRENPKSRRCPVDSETGLTAKERENVKRKLDLEAKLYGRWRHGVDDENILFDSKTDHEVLAKLNWLDKQVDDQRAREQEEAVAHERNLRLQEEINKTELLQKERQKIREQEIREIRSLQDRHMDQLKEREREGDSLKEQEAKLRDHLKDVEKELDLLIESSAGALDSEALPQACNLNKIKVYLRKRSEAFRNQIKLTIHMLERTKAYTSNKSQLDKLLNKYNDQLEAEDQRISRTDTMYESEAKSDLQRCEESWQAQHLERYHDVQELLKAEQSALAAQLNGNMQRQQELLELRSTHLSSIESSNEKLKQLIKEEEDSPRLQPTEGAFRDVPPPISTNTSKRSIFKPTSSSFTHLNLDTNGQELPTERSDIDTSRLQNQRARRVVTPAEIGVEPPVISANTSKSSLPQVSSSFAHLNLDSWHDLPSDRGDDIDARRLKSQRAMRVVTPENIERPKFARKRVAWT